MQHLSKCLPAHWLLSPPGRPLLENFCVDVLDISSVLAFYVADSNSIYIIEEKHAESAIIRANLLWNVDFSLPPMESDAFQYSRATCIDSTLVIIHLLLYNAM